MEPYDVDSGDGVEGDQAEIGMAKGAVTVMIKMKSGGAALGFVSVLKFVDLDFLERADRRCW